MDNQRGAVAEVLSRFSFPKKQVTAPPAYGRPVRQRGVRGLLMPPYLRRTTWNALTALRASDRNLKREKADSSSRGGREASDPVVAYLRSVGSGGGGLVAQLQEHRLGRVPLGHLLVGSRSGGDLAVDLHLSQAKTHAR